MRDSFKSNEKFRSLVDEVSDGIVAIDTEWKMVYVNRTAEKLLSRDHGSLTEKNIWKEFPDWIGGKFHSACYKALQLQSKMFVENYSTGLDRWTQATINPSPKGLIVYLNDITSERKTEERAEMSEKNYRLFIDRITDGFIVLDKDFRYVYVNQKITELIQRDVQSLIGKNIWDEFPGAVNSLTYKAFQTAFKEQRFINNIDYFQPLNLWQENYIYPSPEGLSIVIRDITDRKKLEKELQEKERDRQFDLMVSALEAQEKERTHIGRELHDNVNQLLVATKLMLAIQRDDPAKVNKQMISRCIDNLEKAIEENRKISHELVTPDLKEETLELQLRQLVQAMFTESNIRVIIEASDFDEMALNESRKLAIYRIAQEQCTNIIKYAQAKKVVLTLFNNAEEFTMTIADDGVGMGKTKLATGIGLKNIAARAASFGGVVDVLTKPGTGFTLQVTLPIGADVDASLLDGHQ